MLKHTKLTEARITKALRRIEAWLHPESAPISVEAWAVGGEPVPFEQARQAEYEPAGVGYNWGPLWDTTWFRIRGEVPAAWAGREVVVLFHINGDDQREGFSAEGLIYENGQPVRAINRNRFEIEVAKCASGGEKFEYYVEAAANKADWSKCLKVEPGPLFTITQAELACSDRTVFDYYFDFKVAADAMSFLPEESQRRAELRYALNESLNRLDPDDAGTIPHAREALAGVLAKRNGDTVHQLSAIGHAHMDTAWLWPLRETIRKCARTFSTAADYMDRYPDYVFGCSQAQQYAWMKAHYPTVYAKIKERVQRGQWEPIGSMWVEVDCNLASGESLIRQILQGKRFFQNEFDYETRELWLPDVFGYSAALPQILKGCGIDYFVTQKISWSQFNKFPHHTFFWEGIDGTRIFSHFLPADCYNSEFTARELVYTVDNFKEHGRATRSLFVYGFGDGGGGPTISMLETAGRVQDFDGLPKVKMERVIDFLHKAEQDAKDPGVWVGELYLELHRGTYTTQGATKRGNRKAELLLRDAEFWDAISFVHAPGRTETAATPPCAVYDVSHVETAHSTPHSMALDRAWKLLLLNQFHDIIPGSSITWVYEDAARDYITIGQLGNSVLDSSFSALQAKIDTTGIAEPLRVSNTLNWERREVIAFPDGSLRSVTIPAMGYAVFDVALPPEPAARPVSITEDDSGIEICNGLIRVRIAPNGLLQSVWDMQAGREALAPGSEGNLFQLHEDLPTDFDAWDFDIFYQEKSRDLRELDRMEIIERHPLRAKVRIERSFGKSRIIQDLIVQADSRRIDFETKVHWQENDKLLRVAFPVDILSQRATYEIQFGHVERPTHYNTSWDLARFEVCAHKWADLSEANYGVALLNDCKYGYDIHGNVIRLSLLRSPKYPDPKADRGDHQFTYALMPHQGDFRQGGVIQEAYNLNVPLRADRIEAGTGPLAKCHSFFSTDSSNVVIESVKVAEDNSNVVVRLYEAHGARGASTLRIGLPIKEVLRTDLLENETGETELLKDGTVTLKLRPFEIVTLKLVRPE